MIGTVSIEITGPGSIAVNSFVFGAIAAGVAIPEPSATLPLLVALAITAGFRRQNIRR